MQISFFEEFPNKENLAKLKLLPFPTKLYLGAHSLKEFENIKISSSVKEKIYWPLLKKEEGYWFSPFSKRLAVERILKEIEGKDIPVMIDAELPTHPQPLLYLTEFPSFFITRDYIRSFVAKQKKVYTAEYFPSSKVMESIFFFLGLSFKPKNHYPIKMVYSSMHDFGEEKTKGILSSAKKRYGRRLRVGLGTMGVGIRGDEPSLSKEMLERDLQMCKSVGIEEIIIFRLGGLKKEYLPILEKFL